MAGGVGRDQQPDAREVALGGRPGAAWPEAHEGHAQRGVLGLVARLRDESGIGVGGWEARRHRGEQEENQSYGCCSSHCSLQSLIVSRGEPALVGLIGHLMLKKKGLIGHFYTSHGAYKMGKFENVHEIENKIMNSKNVRN